MWTITYHGAKDPVLGRVRVANLCPILDPTQTTTNEAAHRPSGSTQADKKLLGQAMDHIDWSAFRAQGSIKIQEHEPSTSIRSIRKRASSHTTSTLQLPRPTIYNGDTLPHLVISRKTNCIQLSFRIAHARTRWLAAIVELEVASEALDSKILLGLNTLLVVLTHK